MTQESPSSLPRLEFIDGRWQGEDEIASVSMSDATLERYLGRYLEAVGLVKASARDRLMAAQNIRQLPYWYSVRDADVSVVHRKGVVPRLHYNSECSRYEGADGVVSVIVNASAFEAEVSAYLRVRERQDTGRARSLAKQELLTVAYWHKYLGVGGRGWSVIGMTALQERATP